MIISFKNHISLVNQREKELKEDEDKLEEVKKKKEEKQNILNEIKKINKMIYKFNHKKYDNSSLKIDQVLSLNLNVPITVGN